MTIGDEGLLALDHVTRDRVLALSRNQPIDEGSAQVRLQMRMLLGIPQYHGVLVEQPLVTLNDDLKFAAVLERNPGAAIGKHIGVESGGNVKRCRHAQTGLLAPMAFVFRDIDAGGFPEIEFADVRARAIAARDEWG